MSNVANKIFGRKLKISEFVEKYAIILTFALCLFYTSFTFVQQGMISAGTIFTAVGLFGLLSVALAIVLNLKTGLRPTICVVLCVVSIFVFWRWAVGLFDSKTRALYIFVTLLLILAIVFFTLLLKRKINAKIAICLIFALGFLLRFFYVSFINVGTFQHDINNLFPPFTIDGHTGYINYLVANNFKLPDKITLAGVPIDQYYHPPLHYFICAVWWKFLAKIGIENEFSQQAIQMLPLFYSCVCLILSYKIMRLIKLEGAPLVLAMFVLAVHPTFIIFSGSINNDILSVTFMMAALYVAIKWYQSGKLFDILLCAVYIGLGMMTKTSAGLICVPIAVIFIWKFFTSFSQEKTACINHYAFQFGLFLLICAPLALWWSIRLKVKFGLPFGYVQDLGEGSWQYLGDYTFFQRVFGFIPKQFTWVYDSWTSHGGSYNEFNPIVSLLKTAVFGEYINSAEFNGIQFPSVLLLWSGVVLAILGMVAAMYMLVKTIKSKEQMAIRFSLIIGYFAMLLSYYTFCFKYPYHCSMNIRYVSLLIVFGLIFIAQMFENMSKPAVEGAKIKTRVKVFKGLVYADVIIFALSCIAMFSILSTILGD